MICEDCMSVEETVAGFVVAKKILYFAAKENFSQISKKAFRRVLSNKTMET